MAEIIRDDPGGGDLHPQPLKKYLREKGVRVSSEVIIDDLQGVNIHSDRGEGWVVAWRGRRISR